MSRRKKPTKRALSGDELEFKRQQKRVKAAITREKKKGAKTTGIRVPKKFSAKNLEYLRGITPAYIRSNSEFRKQLNRVRAAKRRTAKQGYDVSWLELPTSYSEDNLSYLSAITPAILRDSSGFIDETPEERYWWDEYADVSEDPIDGADDAIERLRDFINGVVVDGPNRHVAEYAKRKLHATLDAAIALHGKAAVAARLSAEWETESIVESIINDSSSARVNNDIISFVRIVNGGMPSAADSILYSALADEAVYEGGGAD